MTKHDPSAQLVDDLLAERKKLEQWLAKLAGAANQSKAAVASKVRSDYEARLKEVTQELGQYGDGMRKQRDAHAKSLDGLRKQEQARVEEMAEAELRHTVGEFSEAEWKEKKAGITAKLETIRTSLAEAEADIASLDEVLASIAGQEQDEEVASEDEVPELPELPLPPESEAEEAAPAGKKGPGQTDAFGDELDFLKSVTDDEKKGPSAKRASGSMKIPESVKLEEERAPAAPERKPESSIQKDSGAASVGESRPSVMNQRTLECKECGSLNLPTEWYCEKCGAELAGL